MGVIIGRALQGMGANASTLMALVTDLTAEQNRTKAMATIGGSIGISFALAMVLGPIVASSFGMEGIFWLTALLGLVGAIILVNAYLKHFLCVKIARLTLIFSGWATYCGSHL